MLTTGDENHELPLLLGLPLSPILCYFSSACLPGEKGWGGGGELSFAFEFGTTASSVNITLAFLEKNSIVI